MFSGSLYIIEFERSVSGNELVKLLREKYGDRVKIHQATEDCTVPWRSRK